MRYLIREMDYERPVASGNLVYRRDGTPTGMTEAWRFSEALEGYKVLRVDLEMTGSPNSESLLVHGLIKADLSYERIKFRTWGSRVEIEGDLQFEEWMIAFSQILTYGLDNRREKKEEEIPFSQESHFAIPGAAGLGQIAAQFSRKSVISLLTLNREVEYQVMKNMAEIKPAQEVPLMVLGREVPTRPYSISGMEDSPAELWIDRHNWPVRAVMPDGTTAEETAYWRFQSSPLRQNSPA
jgi:hypothetical protein